MGTGNSKNKVQDIKAKNSPKKNRRRSSVNSKNVDLVSEPRGPPKGVRKHSPGRRPRSGSVGSTAAGEFVPYEAEKLNLTGNWELEKGVDDEILMTDMSYPAARPPGRPAADRHALQKVDLAIIQSNLTTPVQPKGTFDEVATQLTEGIEPDVCRVRALTTWLAGQKVRTRPYGADAKPGTVLGYMKQIKENKGTFPGLLAHLCRAIDIPCVIIKGIYRSGNHCVGEDDVGESRCTWNAVHVDGGWQLVHPFLICTPLASRTPADGWKLVESTRQEPPPSNAAVLNNFFFAPKPSEFILFCYPDDSKWQLLEKKVSYQTFVNFPFLRSAFYESGMRLKSESKSTLHSSGGKCLIKIQCPQDTVNQTNMMYELYSSDPEFSCDPELGNIVMCGRNEDTWNVQIQFPEKGEYKLSLFAMLENSWFFWIGDFLIVCASPCAHIVPQPEVPEEVGYGPSPHSEAAGLLCPSHDGGVIFFKPQEKHVIKFQIVDKLLLRHSMESSGWEPGILHRYCRQAARRSEVDFTVQLPAKGQYALRIHKVDENGEETNVVNYLFTDEDESRSRENVFQRKARLALREATAGHEADVLERALEKCTTVKLETDDDVLRGQRRLNYLKLKKGLRDGRMRRHEGTLARAVDDAEQSQFKPALQPNIDKAKELLKCLEEIEISCHAVRGLDHATISEIAFFPNPPRDVHNTMIATYMLLGEDRRDLQRWGYIQGLLRRSGRESINQRVLRFHEDPVPERAVVAAVQKIHQSIPKPYILAASLAAAAFYEWVGEILSQLNNVSKNAIDADSESFEADEIPYMDADVSREHNAGNGVDMAGSQERDNHMHDTEV